MSRSKVEFFEEKSTENVIVPKARQEKPWCQHARPLELEVLSCPFDRRQEFAW
jgi:hypothetical protein